MNHKSALPYTDSRILLGKDDIISQALDALNPLDPEDEAQATVAQAALENTLKRMRVRFGTILKTENVSFLLGAGASIDAGGVSLAAIPWPLEKHLIQRAGMPRSSDSMPDWLDLFYKVASILTGQDLSFEERSTECPSSDTSVEPIPLNLEHLLSLLHTWSASMLTSTDTLVLCNEEYIHINKCVLATLIRTIEDTLTRLLDLPVPAKEGSLRTHRLLLRKLLTRPLNLRRTHLFTLNYDTLIEQAGDAEGVIMMDGFVGTLRRVFRPESYDIDFYFPAQTTEGRVHRYDRVIQLYKLHGSINWHSCEASWLNPFGLYATLYGESTEDKDVLIYPSPLKYGQSLGLPYSEMFRRFGNAVAQPQSTLVVVGYGFGDEHVNAQIRQALAIPSFTLVVVDPNPRSEFVASLEELKDERVWIVSGTLGHFDAFVDTLLPNLREEELSLKVVQTYNKMALSRDKQ